MAKTYLGIKLQDLGVYQTLDPKDKIVIVKDNDEGVMALQEFFFYVQSNLDMGNYYTSTQVNNLFMAKTDTYTRQVMDTKFALVEKTYTRLQSDSRYALLTDTYTKEESDSKYAINDNVYTKEKVYTKDEALFAFALKSEIPILPDLSPYSTTAKGDLRWAMRTDVWSKTEADARFANINNYYTKTETDGKYAVAANTYTKAEADTKFMDTTEAYSKDYINLNMYTKTQVYTKAESNNLYPLKGDVYTVAAVNDQFAAKSWVYSRGDADNTFAPKLTTYTKTEVNSLVDAKVSGLNTNVASSYYTKTDADAKFALIGSSYTKVQTDAKYAFASDVLTATQTAGKYYNKTETDAFFSANVSNADAKFALKTEALKNIAVNPTTLTFTRVDNTIGTVNIPTWNQSTTGNAATATKLATPRTIAMSGAVTAAGVNFDGSSNIAINATSLDATKLTGIVPNANLSGYYTGISFKGINNANNVQFSNELTGTASGRLVLGIVQAKSTNAAQSGAIVIQTSIPALTTSVMKAITVKGMNYAPNGVIDLTISSYNTTTGVNYNPVKINNGGLEIPVKIAANASGKLVYILGEVSDTWSYPHIAVTEALLSYGVTDAYTTGWSISYLTDLTGFTNITAPLTDTVTAIRSKWENIVNTPTTVSGYGITDAYTKTDVYNKTETDARYTPTGTSYSKGETDAKYELKGVAYDKSTSDTRYLPTTPSLVNITNGGVAGATLNLNTTISNSTQLSGLYWNRGTQLISELRPFWSTTNNTWLFGLNLNAGTTSADTTAAASRVLEIYPNYIWHKTYGRMDSYFRLVSDSYTKAEVDTAINNVKAAYLTTANAASTYTTITNYNTLVTRVANEEKARQDLNTYLDTYFAKSSNYWDRDASDAKYYSKSSPTLDINTTADAWTEGGLKLNTTFATGEGPAIQWNANNVTKSAIAASNVSGDMNFYIQQNDNSMGLTFQVSKTSLWHKSFGDLNIYFRKASDSYTTTQVDNAITNALTNYYDKATSDTKYAAAANTYTSAQIDSMVVKVNETRDVTSTGLNKINKILINRTNSPASGISWYSDSYDTWQTIMAQAGVAGQGVKGNVTPSAGTLVTSWALRNIVEPAVGYGWTFESMASGGTTPTIVAEIRSSDGASRFAGAMTVNNDFTANKVNTSVFNTPSVFSFLNGAASQKILTGGVLASNTYADQSLIPTNGIYSRGNIQTAGNFVGTAVTQAVADNSTQIATTAFTQSLTSGVISKAVTGGAVTLTDIEAANQVINLTGTLTSNLAITFPATFKRMWVVYNNTTGAFKVTAGLSAGPSVNVVQGKRTVIYADATGMYEAMNDFESIELTGTPTSTTPALNDASANIATTSYVKTQIANDAPTKSGSGATGTWPIGVTGNSATATKLQTVRTIGLSGAVTGTATNFDGSANITIPTTTVDATKLSGIVPTTSLRGGVYDGASFLINGSNYLNLSRQGNGVSIYPTGFSAWGAGGQVGAIVFTTTVNNLTFLQFRIKGYLANPSKVVDIVGQFYNASTENFITPHWGQKVSYGTIDLPIRVAINSNTGTVYVIVGDVETQWYYPNIQLSEVLFNSGNAAGAQWASKLVTSFTEFGFTGISNYAPNATSILAVEWNNIQNKPTTLATVGITDAYTKSEVYTKTEADSKYTPVGTAYTKAESDGKYGLVGVSYSKAESDAKYTADAQNVTGVSTTTTAIALTKKDGSTLTATVPTWNQSTTGNAATATKLQTTRTIGISGAVTGTAANFDGTSNAVITTTSLDATKLSGIVPNANLSGTYTGVTLDISNNIIYSIKTSSNNASATVYGLGSIRCTGITLNSVIVIKTRIPKTSNSVITLHLKGVSNSETASIDITLSGWVKGNINKLSIGTKDYIIRKAETSDGFICFIMSHPTGYLGTSTAFSIVSAHINLAVDVSTLTNWSIYETTDLSDIVNISQPCAQTTSIVNTLWDNVQSKPTTIAGYGISNAYTKADVYTKTETDSKYTPIGTAYTKSESDDKYALSGSSYTKAEADLRYTTDTQNVTAVSVSPTSIVLTKKDGAPLSATIPVWNQNTTGNAATATTATTTTGNAGTATKLQTTRAISLTGAVTAAGVNFDGSSNIAINATSLDATKLSGIVPNANLSGLYSDVDINLNNNRTIYTTNSGSGRTVYGLAEFQSGESFTGYIVFKTSIPKNSNTMFQLHISGMLYGGGILDTIIKTYQFNGDLKTMSNRVSRGTADISIRFGATPDGYICIIIGDVTSSWYYPHISITHGVLSAHIANNPSYVKGWTSYIATDLTNYTMLTTVYSNDTSVAKVTWDNVQSKPTTIAGYGISNAYTKTEVYSKAETDSKYPLITNVYNKSEVDTKISTIDQIINTVTLSPTNMVFTRKSGATVDVSIPTWNQSTTGNAATASSAAKLTTARKINGVLFDGTADISFTDSTKANLTDVILKESRQNNVSLYRDPASFTTSGTAVGAIVLHLPADKFKSNTMLKFIISGTTSEESANGAGVWDLIVSGYNDSTKWLSAAANLDGLAPFTKVQLAAASNHNVIILGDATTSWANSSINLSEMTASLNNDAGWTGISFTLETDLTPYTIEATPVLWGTNQVKNSVKLLNARDINLTGAVSGTASFDGSSNATIATTLAANTNLTGAPTAATASVNTNTTQLATTAFVMSQIANDAPTKSGTGATGTWSINTSGNAGTATKLATARKINGIAFDGTSDITITDSTKLALSGGTLTGLLVANGGINTSTLNAVNMGVNSVDPAAGNGISLYGGAFTTANQLPTYGISHSGTANFGTHGAVTGDWATYFTISGTATRGWIFKNGNTNTGNVASISATGIYTGGANLTGTPTAPTPAVATNNTQIATTEYVVNRVAQDSPNKTGLGASGTWGISVTGNAASANTSTKLTTARTINGVAFDGTSNISVPGQTTVIASDLRVIKPSDVPKTGASFYFSSKNGLDTGTTSGGEYGDVIALNSYADSSGGRVNALFIGKSQSQVIYHYTGTVGGATWSGVREIAYTDNTALTGVPTAPTAAVGTSTTQIATTAFVNNKIANDAPTKTGGGASGTWGIGVTGNSATATQLATARTISLSGDVTGSVSFDGSANANIVATVADDSHNHSISTVNGLQSALDGIAKTVTGTIPATPGWYRIATSPLDIARNSGRFELDWTQSGSHGQVIFNAAIMFGDAASVSMTQVLYSRYGTLGITKARIVYNTTYTGKYAYLEIYSDSTTALTVNSTGLGLMGWTLLTPSTVGSIPSGYTSREMVFRQGVITEGQLSSTIETGTAPLVVSSTTAVPNLNADMVDNFHASQTIIANTIAVRDGSGNLPGNVTGNAATATKLATARTIAMSGAVTGAATSFDGTSNISINATSVDATKLAGAIPNANMSGIYDGISIRLNKTSSIYTEGSGGKVSGILLSEYRSSNSVTGAIVFTSPHAPNSTMRRIRIQGFLSNGNNCIVDVQVSSYTYSATNINNYGKISLGNRDIDVRFGTDAAGLFCIILGDASTVWSYPHLAITEAQFSHVLPSVDMCNNWSSGIVTDLSTFTAITPYFQTSYSTVQVDWTKIPNSPTSVSGYGITDAYTKTEVNDNFVKLNESRAVTINKLVLNKSSVASAAISWYKDTYNAWQTYMAQGGSTGNGINGNLTAPNGSLVTSWALRNAIENSAGMGWTFESMLNTSTTPTVVAEIRSSDGSAKFNGSITSGADITAGSGIVNTSMLKSSTAIKILNGVAAQGIQMGSLLVSSAYTDETNVPANGIWSKGNIQTAASFVGNTITQVDGTSNTALASTAFVQNAVGGQLYKTGLTGGTVTLTDVDVSNATLAFAGTLTSNLIIIVPNTNKRLWAIINATTGAFTLTVKTASGTGVTVAQGKRNLVYTDGTNVYDAFTDFESIELTGTPVAPTAAVGTATTQIATTAFVNAEIANDAPTKTGGGASGTWGISVTGNAATATTATTATTTTGNAGTATKLATARAINGVNFDGTAAITIADSTKLPLTGGSITGSLSVSATTTSAVVNAANIGISTTDGTAGNGVSLYGGAVTAAGTLPSYGLSFSSTATFGTHGAVTGDWATYFIVNGATSRGWIFKNASTGTANVASISLTGLFTGGADPVLGTKDRTLATTWFVQETVGGYLAKTGLTGGTITLTDAEVSNAVIALTGTLTSNLVVVVPTTNKRVWSFFNNTTGAFTVTVKNPSGTGVTIAQGKRNSVYTDGTNVLDAFNDFENIELTGISRAPTAPLGTATTQIATTEFVRTQINYDAPSKTGAGASGTWSISISGNAATANTATTATTTTGNAATATKLQTSRTINGISFDGTANITVADGTKLPLTGGTLSGNLTVNGVAAATASNATNFGISSTVGTAGNGISLYGGAQTTVGVMPSSGFSYSAPSTFGTHGAVTATDWAVYLTCVGPTNRGWIFKNAASGTTGNVASISAAGQAYFSYVYSSGDMYSSGNISSSGYLYSSLHVNANYVINRAGSYNSDNRHTFYSNSNAAQGASVGNLLVSDNFAQSTNVPTNGIYSKGDIKTAGAITASGDVTAFSDKRLKDNVLPVTNALEKVKQLNGVTFTRTDLEDKETRHIGLIAQDVQAVFPEAVKENEDGILSVNYSGLIGALVETIKELNSKNTELEARLSKLEEKLA